MAGTLSAAPDQMHDFHEQTADNCQGCTVRSTENLNNTPIYTGRDDKRPGRRYQTTWSWYDRVLLSSGYKKLPLTPPVLLCILMQYAGGKRFAHGDKLQTTQTL